MSTASLSYNIMLTLLVLLFLGGASARPKNLRPAGDCISGISLKQDFTLFPGSFQLEGALVQDGSEVEVADDFRVRYVKNLKVVQNLRVNESYILYQCGTKKPNRKDFSKNAKFFEIPLTAVALADVTSSGFLEELDLGDRVQFASEYATHPCLQKIVRRCDRTAVDPGSAFSDPKQVRFQNRKTDAAFISSASNRSNTIAFTATSDPAVLKRAEWVKFVALFFNKEPEANAFFDKIVKRWRAKKTSNRKGPIVAWISYQSYNEKEFFVHFAEYKVEIIKAAGGRPLKQRFVRSMKGVSRTANGYLIKFKKQPKRAIKTLHQIVRDVDVVIDETYQPDNAAYDLDAFYKTYGLTSKSKMPFILEGKIFRLDGTVGNATFGDSLDWYETGVSRPDLVLQDFKVAIGTRKKKKNKSRTWLRNLAEGEKPKRVTHKDCEMFHGCKAKPDVICPSVQVTCDGEAEYREIGSQTCESLSC